VNAYKHFRKPKGKRTHGRLGIDKRITLKWLLKKQDKRMWSGFSSLSMGSSIALINTVMNLQVP
jgi:hypothetical protein